MTYRLNNKIERINPPKAIPAEEPWISLIGPALSRLKIPTKIYPTFPTIPKINPDLEIPYPMRNFLKGIEF